MKARLRQKEVKLHDKSFSHKLVGSGEQCENPNTHKGGVNSTSSVAQMMKRCFSGAKVMGSNSHWTNIRKKKMYCQMHKYTFAMRSIEWATPEYSVSTVILLMGF